ncbi:hypothetical protein B0H66DRAFT_33580 [Apodospora peruviana]|uniref:Uncharacterized protein n=1 Tax=Apodospora peruviana TaxID=516989 RepID=A0AAE0IR22_9PEZI|nr:hypothetical protein B0H66DRAFT_33580 [Apodospora peruviana]
MATSMPLPFKSQMPATPPPDHPSFAKESLAPEMPKSATQETYKPSTHAQIPQNNTTTPPKPATAPPPGPNCSDLSDLAKDPRYLAMASRIASYYQQRCQAVANFQQQRCQAWANMHRQKCQEMMQASMLIVAWYIRDRISRRRRRQKRQFKRRLSEKCARSKVTKGESVRRWVMNLPLGAASSPSNVHDKLADEEEATFSMDKEPTPDKDTQLFNVADNLIKSQLARIDVPLLGALSFDESESESEDDDMRDYEEEEEEEYEDEEDYEQPDDRAGHEKGDGDGNSEREREEPGMGSEEVQLGTGTGQGSRKRNSSSLIS